MAIDFAFWIFAPKGGPLGPIRGLPPFLHVTFHERATEPQLFALDASLRASIDPASLDAVAHARALHVVRASVVSRLADDVQLQLAIQAAAQIALRVGASVVVDAHAMRAMTPAAFAATGESKIENHVTYAMDGDVLVSRGLAKYGFADVELDPGWSKPVDCAPQVLDTACSGLVVGLFQVGIPFELARAHWVIEPTATRSVLRCVSDRRPA